MAKRQKKPASGANWMDTYGDMVTLLLCFYVLLYSMSTISEDKWKIIVASFNPNAIESAQIVTTTEIDEVKDGPVEGNYEEVKEEEIDFDELYVRLSKYVEENNYSNDIEVSKGDGFTFITFKDNVFFDGNSYVLKDGGKRVLDYITETFGVAEKSIKEIRILGHTSQASPYEPNEPKSDRFLASNRATEVLLYIQLKNLLDPAKLVACSYGQFRPISTFDTYENRAKNRRVEILVTKNDSQDRSIDEYYNQIVIE